MSELKRVPVKAIRDFIKKGYKKDTKCYICRSEKQLELHHTYSLSELFHSWAQLNTINVEAIKTFEEMDIIRIRFSQTHIEELSVKNSYTLCKQHHERLHNLFGQRYENRMVPKVKNWIEIQRGKYSV